MSAVLAASDQGGGPGGALCLVIAIVVGFFGLGGGKRGGDGHG